MITYLVESVYMLDLLNLELDEKVLGVLFLLTPILIIFFRKKIPNYFIEIVVLIFIITRIITPLLSTSEKIISAGIGVGCFLIFLPAYFSKERRSIQEHSGLQLGIGLAFSVALSILFRTVNSTLDISISGVFQFIGWILAAMALIMIIGKQLYKRTGELTSAEAENEITPQKTKGTIILTLVLGLISVLTLIYFAFGSPTVIARWTEGNYTAIIITLISVIGLFSILVIRRPEILKRVSKTILLIWNGAFVLSLVLSIALHVIPFPATPSAPPVVVLSPAWFYHIPLYIMLVLSPVIFLDFALLSREIAERKPTISQLAISFTIGGLFLMILIFIIIFTNVWGYVDVVSLIFRNLFWLPFLIIGLGLFGSVFLIKKRSGDFKLIFRNSNGNLLASIIMIIIALSTVIGVFATTAFPATPTGSVSSIRVYTYNIQQGVNTTGEKNYDGQLALIKAINPDIIGLQECDTARISGGNSDIVRYFSDRLRGFNYFSYYGPKTVTGTYGAAVLSKFPIIDVKSVFTYSDVDEIGTAEVQILIGSDVFNVWINHPAGGHEAKLAHITAIMNRIGSKTRVISMGDFNFRQDSEYYNLTLATLQDAWLARWPTGVDDNGLNMSSRIDHIFLSGEFTVVDARYVTDPQSDHPAHWAEITW